MPLRVFAALTAFVVIGLVILMLYAGEPDKLWWWGMAIPFGAWIIGPAITPYLTARRRADRVSLIAMLSFFLPSSVAAGVMYFEAFFRSQSSTAALVFVFIPLYQWFVFFAVLAGVVVGQKMINRRRH